MKWNILHFVVASMVKMVCQPDPRYKRIHCLQRTAYHLGNAYRTGIKIRWEEIKPLRQYILMNEPRPLSPWTFKLPRKSDNFGLTKVHSPVKTQTASPFDSMQISVLMLSSWERFPMSQQMVTECSINNGVNENMHPSQQNCVKFFMSSLSVTVVAWI